MINMSFNCIIPTLKKDYIETREHLYDLIEMYTIKRIVIIGPEKLSDIVNEDAEKRNIADRVSYINGNELIPFERVQSAYNKRLSELKETASDQENASSVGWYYQQFIKYAYSNICDTDYYMCWDADTIPLRKTDMFSPTGEAYLDIKSEYLPSYFTTIKNLFGFNKIIEKSFISGHMLFKKDYVAEMTSAIMGTGYSGKEFFDKIFNAATTLDHGFSEFETYGTWVAIKHPNAYRLREWRSLRNASLIINRTDLTKDDLEWLSTGFDAANFERYQDAIPELTDLFRSTEYRKKMSSDKFYQTLLESGVFGEYRNSGLVVGDIICPV